MSPQAKVFHVVSVKLLVESTKDGDGTAAYEQTLVALEAARGLIAHVTGREVRTKAAILEPIRLIELAHEEQPQEETTDDRK
jgi:hypothetical protein